VKIMTFVRTDERLLPPPQSFFDAMEKELPGIDADITMVRSEALLPTAVAGARVRSTGGRTTVLDGPFTEAREVIGGYAIIEVDTWEQGVETARRFVGIHERSWPGWSGEAEVRRLAD
jgi:hypothetical protein